MTRPSVAPLRVPGVELPTERPLPPPPPASASASAAASASASAAASVAASALMGLPAAALPLPPSPPSPAPVRRDAWPPQPVSRPSRPPLPLAPSAATLATTTPILLDPAVAETATASGPPAGGGGAGGGRAAASTPAPVAKAAPALASSVLPPRAAKEKDGPAVAASGPSPTVTPRVGAHDAAAAADATNVPVAAAAPTAPAAAPGAPAAPSAARRRDSSRGGGGLVARSKRLLTRTLSRARSWSQSPRFGAATPTAPTADRAPAATPVPARTESPLPALPTEPPADPRDLPAATGRGPRVDKPLPLTVPVATPTRTPVAPSLLDTNATATDTADDDDDGNDNGSRPTPPTTDDTPSSLARRPGAGAAPTATDLPPPPLPLPLRIRPLAASLSRLTHSSPNLYTLARPDHAPEPERFAAARCDPAAHASSPPRTPGAAHARTDGDGASPPASCPPWSPGDGDKTPFSSVPVAVAIPIVSASDGARPRSLVKRRSHSASGLEHGGTGANGDSGSAIGLSGGNGDGPPADLAHRPYHPASDLVGVVSGNGIGNGIGIHRVSKRHIFRTKLQGRPTLQPPKLDTTGFAPPIFLPDSPMSASNRPGGRIPELVRPLAGAPLPRWLQRIVWQGGQAYMALGKAYMELDTIERRQIEEGLRHAARSPFGHVHATLARNASKNRYINILPFDTTRVVLQTPVPTRTPGETTDYTNASYVRGPNAITSYIAAQGPLASTVGDFWQMAWEQRASLVVMLTPLAESGREKCARYWPDAVGSPMTVTAGVALSVTLYSETPVQQGEIVLRDLGIRRLSGGPSPSADDPSEEPERRVWQLHYMKWPDQKHANVGSVLGVIDLMHAFLARSPADSGPPIVHCSAGCGRTGVLMVADTVLALLASAAHDPLAANGGGKTDLVYLSLHHMRTQRMGLVQTQHQYAFCYELVLGQLGRWLRDSRFPHWSGVSGTPAAGSPAPADAGDGEARSSPATSPLAARRRSRNSFGLVSVGGMSAAAFAAASASPLLPPPPATATASNAAAASSRPTTAQVAATPYVGSLRTFDWPLPPELEAKLRREPETSPSVAAARLDGTLSQANTDALAASLAAPEPRA